MAKPRDLLIFAQIGDLHIEMNDQHSLRAFASIIDEIERDMADTLDFVYLPGDIANFGKAREYDLVKPLVARLRPPVHAISGDHDMNEGCLDAFYAHLEVPTLPYAQDHAGIRCLFLDMCGTGSGQLDFQLGPDQCVWLENELADARRAGRRCAVFMHTYPDDLTSFREKAAVIKALATPDVLLVAMGHTHYNELANDGRKIYAATRSTGQIEEGTVGYSVTAIDGSVVSWRFRPLDSDRPLVLVTAPADRRLATRRGDPDHAPRGRCEVRATVLWSNELDTCSCSIDGGPPVPMASEDGRHFSLEVDLPPDARSIVVEATQDTAAAAETIEIARPCDFDRFREANGSDADRVGRWIERGIFGTQLGPNRNGRHW